MAYFRGPNLVTNGLILCLDAANPKSYSGSGTTWNDLSGNGNNGTLVNGPTFSSTNNGSIVFDGIDDYIGVLYTPILTPTNQISFGSVAFLNNWNTSSNIRILSKTQNGGYHIGFNDPLYTNSLGGLVFAGGSYRVAKYNLASISSGWHHIFYTFDGRYFRMYLDGVQVDFSDIGSTVSISYNSNNSLLIGAEVGAGALPDGNYFNGRISSMHIYNRALSSTEVLQNFNTIRSRYNI